MDRGPILFFDGVCNLCQGAVQTVLTNDRSGSIKFASLQSDLAKELLPRYGVDPSTLDSVVLYTGDKVYTHSEGALRTAGLMGGPWSFLRVFTVIPKPIRDRVYDWIAANRYRWFGKQEACWMPRPEWKARFLD